MYLALPRIHGTKCNLYSRLQWFYLLCSSLFSPPAFSLLPTQRIYSSFSCFFSFLCAWDIFCPCRFRSWGSIGRTHASHFLLGFGIGAFWRSGHKYLLSSSECDCCYLINGWDHARSVAVGCDPSIASTQPCLTWRGWHGYQSSFPFFKPLVSG